MDNWREFFSFNDKGTPLKSFLNTVSRAELANYRVLYIIRPVAEPGVIKFGISDGAGYDRLSGYVHSYGTIGKNKCLGVHLLYLAGVRKKLVAGEAVPWTIKNSQIKKMEKLLKDTLPIVRGRGDERTTAPLSVIRAVMISKGKNLEDEPVVLRRSVRTTQVKPRRQLRSQTQI